ncbi:Riboflavin synthase [Pseudomonas fluorescens]|nr:Riboflavin synthase [Pseudomonas fluorescens]
MKLSMALPQEVMHYLFVKGFVAVNGASLTVASIERNPDIVRFNLVPETLRQTTFKDVNVGDRLNIEADPITRVLVDTLRRIIPSAISFPR